MSNESERLLRLENRVNQVLSRQKTQVQSSSSYNLRLARVTVVPTSGNTFTVEFIDGSYVRANGIQALMQTDRNRTAICQNLRNVLPDVGTVLAVFEWSGYWWTDYYGPAGTATNIVIMESDPSVLVTPNTFALPDNVPVVVDMAGCVITGTETGITPQPASDQIEYATGDYQLEVEVRMRATGGTYPPGHPNEFEDKTNTAKARLEYYDGAAWQLTGVDATVDFGSPPASKIALLSLALEVLVGDSPKAVRVVVEALGASDDASVQIYHTIWQSSIA